jgi:hypothetical protein
MKRMSMWVVCVVLGLGCSEAAKDQLGTDGGGTDLVVGDQQGLDGFLGQDNGAPLDLVSEDGLAQEDGTVNDAGLGEDLTAEDTANGDLGLDGVSEDTSSPDLAQEDLALPDTTVFEDAAPLDTTVFEDTVQGSKCAPVGNLGWKRLDGIKTWAEAKTACEEDSRRLPNICELRSLVQGCPETGVSGLCGVTTECTDWCVNGEYCLGCTLNSGPGVNGCYLSTDGPCGYYWSSTAHGSWPKYAWMINFETAHVFNAGTAGKANVYCVN